MLKRTEVFFGVRCSFSAPASVVAYAEKNRSLGHTWRFWTRNGNKTLRRAFKMDASLEQIQLECLNYVNLGSVKWLRVYISDQWWQLISAKSHFLCDSTRTRIYYLGLVRKQKLWRYGKLFLHTYSVRGVNSARKAWIQAVGSARGARQTQVCGRVFRALHLSFVRRQRWEGVSFATGYFQTPLYLYPTLFCLTNDVSFQS